MRMQTVERAIEASFFGAVFPCAKSKLPAIKDWPNRATDDRDKIREWNWDNKLVGLVTGELSDLTVVDIDPRNNGDVWLADNIDKIPPTRIHETRSGGIHLLFRDVGLSNSAGKIAEGVDIRANGGFVVWWPAIGIPVVSNHPIAPLPSWIYEALRSQPVPGNIQRRLLRRTPYSSQYIAGAVRNGLMKIRTAPEGERNNTLNVEAFSLARLVEQDLLTELLVDAGRDAGLELGPILATIDSAYRGRARQGGAV